jgi:hypothetical protein
VGGQLIVSDGPGAADVTASGFRIGVAVGTDPFAGQLDEVAIFSTVLSAGGW